MIVIRIITIMPIQKSKILKIFRNLPRYHEMFAGGLPFWTVQIAVNVSPSRYTLDPCELLLIDSDGLVGASVKEKTKYILTINIIKIIQQIHDNYTMRCSVCTQLKCISCVTSSCFMKKKKKTQIITIERLGQNNIQLSLTVSFSARS